MPLSWFETGRRLTEHEATAPYMRLFREMLLLAVEERRRWGGTWTELWVPGTVCATFAPRPERAGHRDDRSLTRPTTPVGDCVYVTGCDERVVVIRAWRHADRLLIRVLASKDPDAPGEEWVFADIPSALDRLQLLLLDELHRGDTKR